MARLRTLMYLFVLAAGLSALPTRATSQDDPAPAKPVLATTPGYAFRIVKPEDRAKRPNWAHVEAALNWLRDHQCENGSWDPFKFYEASLREKAKATHNLELVSPKDAKGDLGWDGDDAPITGLTALSLLCFFAEGFHHFDGPYKDSISRALEYLVQQQRADGYIGANSGDTGNYNHALSTLALCEAYGLTGDSILLKSCKLALQKILDLHKRDGWRYASRPEESDPSSTGWMCSALKAGKLAGLDVPLDEHLTRAFKMLDDLTTDVNVVVEKEDDTPKDPKPKPKDPKAKAPDPRYVTGYNSPGGLNARLRSAQKYECNDTCNAVNIYLRLMGGDKNWTTRNKVIANQVEYLGKARPAWVQYKIDFYYWHYASLALFQAGGKDWSDWDKVCSKTLLDKQRGWVKIDQGANAETLDEYGSWDAVDCWHACGGRLYSTALNCLTLQTAYRYTRFEKKK